MREIKFRAWDKKYSKIEPDVIKNLPWTGRTFEDVVKDDRYILMQYTGLKDKNGKEIYEGDIVKINDEILNKLGKVFFSDFRACFAVDFSYANNDLFYYVKYHNYTEVIGNIYENPELLEVINEK